MNAESAPQPLLVDYGVAAFMLSGETESGDLFLVEPFSGGLLIAVVDGLGHGQEAALAARITISVLRRYASESVGSLIRICHEELHKTRGAVLSLASFNAQSSTMSWLGVGNVEGTFFFADPNANPKREALLLRGGVVGSQLPPLRPRTIPVKNQDTLIFITDGIHSNFSQNLDFKRNPQEIADGILAQHKRGNDDALVLAVRYLGIEQ